jgi:hypothetical protein
MYVHIKESKALGRKMRERGYRWLWEPIKKLRIQKSNDVIRSCIENGTVVVLHFDYDMARRK